MKIKVTQNIKGKWLVKTYKETKSFELKKHAVGYAYALSDTCPHSTEIVIHKANGQVQEKRKY
jgi:hypothetical protein